MSSCSHIIFCNCQYARVISPEVKQEVLNGLSSSNVEFHAVPDLCESASRNDPVLHKINQSDSLQIVACYPRAVKGLFHQCGAPLNENVEILNMREHSAEDILETLNIMPAVETEKNDG